jgi:hypothetical protein
MAQETPTPQPDPQPKKTKSKGETTYAGKLGDWQRILTPLAANAADLPHLEMPRAQLATLLAQAVDIKQQQAAGRAVKETASLQLQSMIVDGQRLAALLRQAVKQHYGPRSPKLTEFNLQPFRGRTQTPVPTPTPTPPPTVEVTSATAAASSATPKTASDPASHS